MKKLSLILLLVIASAKASTAQSLYFPPLTGSNWDSISPASIGWCQPPIDSLFDYLQANNTKAFIILKDGKIVIEKYFDNFTKDSLWYWASAGKTLTSFLVGLAQEDGYLSINDKSSQYIGNGWTSCTQGQEDLITVRNQLTMTTGLDDNVPDDDCYDDTCLIYEADAGTRWAYHNAPYTLLDSVISVSTGQSINNYLLQKVKVKTGMTGFYYKSGYLNVYYSTPRSFARFGLLMLGKGKWNGVTVMADTNYFNEMINTSQNLNLSYGYLWWLNGKTSFMAPTSQIVFPRSLNPSAPQDMYAGLGKNGQILNVVPSQNLVLIRMGNDPNAGNVPISFNDTIWQYLNRAYCTTTIRDEDYLSLKVYPNPAKEKITVTCNRELNYFLISDITGKEILQGVLSSSESTINISDLQKGLYTLRIYTDNKIINRKIIINN